MKLWPAGVLLLGAALLAPRARAEMVEVRQIARGMECAECARNLTIEARKLDGVEATAASWNRRVLTVRFRRGARTTLADVRTILRHQHFVPGEAEVLVIGRLVTTADGAVVLDAGAGVRFRLVGFEPSQGSEGEVVVTGRVPGEPRDLPPEPRDGGAPGPLFVLEVKGAPSSLKPPHGVVDSASGIPRATR